MTEKNQDPLDLQEVVSSEKEIPTTPLQRFLQNLEIVPLIILAIGLWMKYQDMGYSSELLIIGGTTSAVLYIAFSWLMFIINIITITENMMLFFPSTMCYMLNHSPNKKWIKTPIFKLYNHSS